MRRLAVAAAMVAALGLLAWGTLVEPYRLGITRLDVTVPQWPAGTPALKAVFLTDLHVGGPQMGLERLDQLVAIVAAERPDVVLLGGDYVIQHLLGGTEIPPEDIAAHLAAVRPRLGLVSVLGNHDWWLDGDRVRHALAANGIRVLENHAVNLGPLWVAGLADDTTRIPDAVGALAGVPADAAVIGLMHDPANLPDWPRPLPLLLAGHTHAGQVRLPVLGPIITPGRAPRAWSHGGVELFGQHLYVSAGLGVSELPIRLNAPPELVVVTLRPAAP